jgi:hypothetical protein
MKTKHILCISLAVLSFARCNSQLSDRDETPLNPVSVPGGDSMIIAEAISYKNLQVFPVILQGKTKTLNFMVLSEALQKQKAVVKETGNVGQLEIDNLSDEYIFILAGDIVKGGRQDRTMGNDVIVAPHAKNVSLESFCVESGRWQQRGDEVSEQFSDNTKMLSSKELKMASRYHKNQSAVWQNVSDEQEKLKNNVSSIKGQDVEVTSVESETSLQLTLENENLEDVVKEYKTQLDGLIRLPAGTTGYAYAINGELYGIDIFSDSTLFYHVKEKLIDAMIVEAISEFINDSTFTQTNAVSISTYLVGFDKPAKEVTSVNTNTSLEVSETEKAVKFETKLRETDVQWVRKNYLVKSEEGKMNR